MKVIHGDLIRLAREGRFDVIVHGCNCMCTMGAGIARQIATAFPEARSADLHTPKGDRSKLGTISVASILRANNLLMVANAYTQYTWTGSGNKVDLRAVRHAMRAVKARFTGKRIGYPMIGAGLGGGNWDDIGPIIEQELAGEDHTLVVYEGDGHDT